MLIAENGATSLDDKPPASSNPSTSSSMSNDNERSGNVSATSLERATPADKFTKEKVNARFSGCSPLAQSYEILSKLGEGTFGQVFKAIDKRSSEKCNGATGRIVALKKIIVHNEKEGFPITALREIRILKSLRHDNIIPVIDMSITRGKRSEKLRGDIYMVTPYMEHDLAGLLGNPKIGDFTIPQIKCYMKQLLLGINYIHQQGYLHRDIKAANLLIDNYGILKIADFGLAKQYSEAKPTKETAGPPGRKYTGMVVTRWYRAPELILGEKCYTTAVDMWGIGCVFGEMFNRKPIFQGSSDIDQGYLIFMNVGAPTKESMPGWDNLPNASSFNLSACNKPVLKSSVPKLSNDAFSFLKRFLTLNPQTRCTALGALEDAYFTNEPKIARPEDLPQFEDSHELDSRNIQQQQQQQQLEQTYQQNNYQNGQYSGQHSGQQAGYRNGSNQSRNHNNSNNRRNNYRHDSSRFKNGNNSSDINRNNNRNNYQYDSDPSSNQGFQNSNYNNDGDKRNWKGSYYNNGHANSRSRNNYPNHYGNENEGGTSFNNNRRNSQAYYDRDDRPKNHHHNHGDEGSNSSEPRHDRRNYGHSGGSHGSSSHIHNSQQYQGPPGGHDDLNPHNKFSDNLGREDFAPLAKVAPPPPTASREKDFGSIDDGLDY